jgi:hypothetical protein
LVRDKRMLETGQIVDAPEAARDELFAADFVRYSTRRVTVPAGGSQTVRIMLRNPSEELLQEGEYRTHLIFQSVPNPAFAADPREADHQVARAIIETSIPVIIRRGDPSATVRFGAAAVDTLPDPQGRPVLDLRLERGGARSVYGDIDVFWIDGNGRSVQVSRIVGIAVYTPTPRREVHLPLTFPDGGLPDHGILAIRFSETAAGLGDLVAETTVDLKPVEVTEE